MVPKRANSSAALTRQSPPDGAAPGAHVSAKAVPDTGLTVLSPLGPCALSPDDSAPSHGTDMPPPRADVCSAQWAP